MNNALAAILGGLSGGARSLGTSRMAVEADDRRNQQRLDEIAAQEQAKASERRLLAELQEQQRKSTRAAGVNSIRALFPNFQEPEGDFDPSVVMKGMLDREATKRYEMGQDGQTARLERTLGGRLDQISSQGNISREIADMNNTSRMAIAKLMEGGRNSRDNGENDYVVKRAASLIDPEYDKYGQVKRPGMTPEQASAKARAEFKAMMGMPGAGAPAQSGQNPPTPMQNKSTNASDPREGQLAAMAQRKIQEIMSSDDTPQEKQALVQQVNSILSQQIAKLRGGM